MHGRRATRIGADKFGGKPARFLELDMLGKRPCRLSQPPMQVLLWCHLTGIRAHPLTAAGCGDCHRAEDRIKLEAGCLSVYFIEIDAQRDAVRDILFRCLICTGKGADRRVLSGLAPASIA